MAQVTNNTLNKSCDEIRHEIDRTRDRIDRKLDTIESRLTAREIGFDAWSAVREGGMTAANKAWRGMQDHPMPATMIAAGIGWLLYESGSGRRSSEAASGAASSVRESAGRAKDRLADAGGRISEAASSTADRVSERASEAVSAVRENVSQIAASTKEHAAEITDAVKEQAYRMKETTRARAQQAREGFWQLLEEQPLAMGAAFIVAGIAAGLAIPTSRREDQLMGATRDRFLDSAKETGRGALEKGRHVAEVAVDVAKQAAEKAQLDPATVAAKVRQVGQETKQAVTEEVSHTKI